MVFVNSVRENGEDKIIERPVERAVIDVVLPELADGALIRGNYSEPPPRSGQD
jgi:hypothetical protein